MSIDATAGGPPAEGNLPEYTVSELAGSVKRAVEGAFDHVRVRGELGRVTFAKSGHIYADLKDDRACIASVMWKTSAANMRIKPEEGMEVIVEGRLTTYAQRSQYQLIIERLEPAGAGALMALLEERKKRLAAEGLFDDSRKQPLPFLPDTIGVVTSPTGAVIRDILHRIADRFPRRVLLWPVLVQGDQAAPQVSAAIAGFNTYAATPGLPRPDLIIVARGGGSIEDLWAFNEESVVRAAAASRIPLISAIGHETDWTLLDLAADWRAPTPTGAAERAVPVRADLVSRIAGLNSRTLASRTRLLERASRELRAAVRALGRPEAAIAAKQQQFDSASARLNLKALQRGLDERGLRLADLSRRSRACVSRHARDASVALARSDRMRPAALRLLDRKEQRLKRFAQALDALNPKTPLSRGYALVHGPDGRLVTSARVDPGTRLQLEFADGRAAALVEGGPLPPPAPPGPASSAGGPAPGRPKITKKSPGLPQGELF